MKMQYTTPEECRIIENEKYYKNVVKKVHYIVDTLVAEGYTDVEIMEWVNKKVKEDMTMVKSK